MHYLIDPHSSCASSYDYDKHFQRPLEPYDLRGKVYILGKQESQQEGLQSNSPKEI